MKSKVYFSRTITPEKVLELYKLTGKTLGGKVAIKIHSGEAGNQNFLKPDFWKPVIDHVGGTVVECNTAYDGSRNTTEKHMKTMHEHGWSKYFQVELLDAEDQTWSSPFRTEKRSKRTLWANRSLAMIPCWYSRTSRDIPWAVTAGQSSSSPSVLPPPWARPISMVWAIPVISGAQTTILS